MTKTEQITKNTLLGIPRIVFFVIKQPHSIICDRQSDCLFLWFSLLYIPETAAARRFWEQGTGNRGMLLLHPDLNSKKPSGNRKVFCPGLCLRRAPVDTEGPDRAAVKRRFVYTAFTFVTKRSGNSSCSQLFLFWVFYCQPPFSVRIYR